MLENKNTPLNNTSDSTDITGWHEVASQLHNWHPDLRRHAIRNLASRGISYNEIDESDENYQDTDHILEQLKHASDDKLGLLWKYSSYPSSFVRFEVALHAKRLNEESLLAFFSNDPDNEISHFSKRAIAELTTRQLSSLVDTSKYYIELSDVFTPIPDNEGTRVIIAKKADLNHLNDKYSLDDNDVSSLNLEYHFKPSANLSVFYWATIEITFDKDGKKSWLIDEMQSDILQKTKNKALKKDYSKSCETCYGVGISQITKKEQVRCPECQGMGSIPIYPEKLMSVLSTLATQTNIERILIPPSESITERYAGLIKPTKAKLLYDTVPRQIGFTKTTIDDPITFGCEDGSTVTSSVFWALPTN